MAKRWVLDGMVSGTMHQRCNHTSLAPLTGGQEWTIGLVGE